MGEIDYGTGNSKYGPGVDIRLDGDQLAQAVMLYLFSQEIYVEGARTIYVNGELCKNARVYVDPSGSVMAAGERWSGRGPKEDGEEVPVIGLVDCPDCSSFSNENDSVAGPRMGNCSDSVTRIRLERTGR